MAQNEVVWMEIVKYVTSYKGYKSYTYVALKNEVVEMGIVTSVTSHNRLHEVT